MNKCAQLHVHVRAQLHVHVHVCAQLHVQLHWLYSRTGTVVMKTLKCKPLLHTTTMTVYSIMIIYASTCEMWAFPFCASVTAYSKEISNESCREASETLVMRNHSVLRA